MNEQMQRLAVPFEPRFITWKPGSTTRDNTKCLAMAYADTRAYQERLDDVFEFDWQTSVQVISDKQVLCTVTIPNAAGELVSRSATAEDTDLMSAEARAFKRACSAFGLGRYLYDLPSVWVEFDAQRKRISDDGKAKLDAHYRTWYLQHTQGHSEPTATQPTQPAQRSQAPTHTADETFGADTKRGDVKPATLERLNELGSEFYNGEWAAKRQAIVKAASGGETSDPAELFEREAQVIITGIEKRMKAPVAA